MFKVLSAKANLGGTMERRALAEAMVRSDLEKQLNDGSVLRVNAVAPYVTDSEIHLIAVVEVTADKPKKGDK